MIKDFECFRVDGEEVQKSGCPVAEEVPLSILVNGRHFATAMISPQLRREFVAGHLYSERILSSIEEIESIEVEGDVARAIVANPIRATVPRRPIVSGCGGVASFLDESKLPRMKSDLTIRVEQAQEAMKAISLSETHIATGGVHSVGLFDQSGPVSIIEDIGRHNALDKAIGSLILREGGFDLGRTFAACTGRVSSDMALKCSAVGIPIAVSRGATTSLAITIAQRTGLSIIGFLRGKRLSVYANPERFVI